MHKFMRMNDTEPGTKYMVATSNYALLFCKWVWQLREAETRVL